MKKIISLVIIIVLLVSLTAPLSIAKDKGPVVKVVEVHYKKAKGGNPGKPGGGTGGGTGELSPSYKYSGIHWANPNVSYKVNTSGSGITDETSVLAAVNASFDTWEYEVNSVGRADNSAIDYEYLGSTSKTGAALDNENTLNWGPISDHGVIAVTTYWYYRTSKEIVEFDITMNNNLKWATDGDSTAFDVQNIATHEAGHTLVLGDLYKSKDDKLTMYGYSAPGETIKRDLGLGDCLGVEKIYPVN